MFLSLLFPSSEENYQTQLFNVERADDQLPIVYSDEYNIRFGGMQKLHPFDSEKWGRIANYLESMSASFYCMEPCFVY